MSAELAYQEDPRVTEAIKELQAIIRRCYPDAQFRVARSEDDLAAIHLHATVDVDDTEDLVDLVIGRMMQIQIEDELPIYVIPIRSPERVAALRRDVVATPSWAHEDLFERIAVITER